MLRIVALGVCLVLAEVSKANPPYKPPYTGDNYPPTTPPYKPPYTDNYPPTNPPPYKPPYTEKDNSYPYPGGDPNYPGSNYFPKIEYRKVDRCKKDQDCKNDLICLNFWCIPIQCQKDKDCGSPKLACSRGRCLNRQRKCYSDKQCGKGYICEKNFCVFEQCWRDEDCGSGNSCDRGRCVNKPRCTDDRQCGRGRICEDTFCIPRQCNKEADCLEQDTCFRGRCLADCTPCYYRDPRSKSNECIYKCKEANEYCDEGKCVCNYGYFRNNKKQCEIKPPPQPKEYYPGTNDNYPRPPYQPKDRRPPYPPQNNYPARKPGKKECYDGRC